MSLREANINGKPVKLDNPATLEGRHEGILKLTVSTPAVLLSSEPMALSDQVRWDLPFGASRARSCHCHRPGLAWHLHACSCWWGSSFYKISCV